MPQELAQLTWILVLAWFLIYWIAGGMMFAIVALTRLLKLKKAQFSCLFTFASLAAAYGAAATGLMMTTPAAARCVDSALQRQQWSEVFGCGMKEILLVGGAWFALLLLLSILFMLLSQREIFPTKLEHH